MAQNNKKKEKEIKLPVTVRKENFTTDDGEIIAYYSYAITIGDETFRLQPKPEDKRMLKFMLNDLFDNQAETENKEQENEDNEDL